MLLGCLCTSCKRTECDCSANSTKETEYVGHCTCGGETCSCPVRLHINTSYAEYEVWHKDPLTTSDTLYIKIKPLRDEYVIDYINYGYYYIDMKDNNDPEPLVKMVLPVGKYEINITYTQYAEGGGNSISVYERVLPEVVVKK